MGTDEILYRRLQEHINRMPVGFPKSETGADLRILKQLFTVEEAQVALELSMLPETIDRIYPRIKDMGYTKEQAEDCVQPPAKPVHLRFRNRIRLRSLRKHMMRFISRF